MKYPSHIWNQLKNIKCDDLIRALNKDEWKRDETRGAAQIFRHLNGNRVSIHYHPNKTYKPGLLKSLLQDIGWSEKDLRRLKLIK